MLALLAFAASWAACSSSRPSGSSSSQSSRTGPEGGSCSATLTACGEYCVDVKTSVLNCGNCGAACPTGQSCRSGACAPSVLCADGGLTECTGVCTDLATSNTNCGDCARACGYLQSCAGGTCAQPCPKETVLCAGTCIEPANHGKFCGATAGCGNGSGSKGTECAPEQRCVDGHCVIDCPAGESPCGAGVAVSCKDVRIDGANCGKCGNACGASGTCSRGICCPLGQEACQGQCKNTQTDPLACGGCGTTCDVGKTCIAGLCSP